MSKKVKLALATVGTLFLVGLVWLFYFFPISSLCLSPDKYFIINAKSAIFSPDGNDIAFAKWEKVHQRSQGICEFPDGGSGRTLIEQISVYKNPVDTLDAPVLLAVIPIPRGYSVENGYELLGWDNGNIYLSHWSPRKGDMSPTEIYYRIDPNAKKFFKLKKSEIETIKTKFPKEEVHFYPKDKTMWLLNKEGIGLGLYTQEGGTPNTGTGMPKIIKKLIVSDNTLYKSSFSYVYYKSRISYCDNGYLR